MKVSETAREPETPLSQDLLHAARYYLGGRRGLIALAALVAVAGAALNWSWLVALGVAPLLLSLLPCLAMCALGLCMNKMAGKSCSAGTDATKSAAPAEPPPPQVLPAAAADVEPLDARLRVPAPRAEPAAEDMSTAEIAQPQTPDERK